MQRAPFFRRLAARVLDLLFSLLLTFLVAIPMSVIVVLVGPAIEPFIGRSLWWGFTAALCYVIAYIGLEVFLLVRREGQTLGKGRLGLRVVGTANGAALSMPAALTRMLIIFAPFVLMSLAGGRPESRVLDAASSLALLAVIVSLVLAAIPTARRQALHDLAAHSWVVRAPVRKISWRQDVRMIVPGKIDLTKRY